jgi:hypothetical protein
MNRLEKEALPKLLDARWAPCVSIYMPTHSRIWHARQGVTRFRDLLTDAEGLLREGGWEASEIKRVLEPAAAYVADAEFWRGRSRALGAFLSPKLHEFYALPFEVREGLFINRRFMVWPLVRLFLGDGCFYLLALATSRIRLLRGSRSGLEELPLEGVLEGFAHIPASKALDKKSSFPPEGPTAMAKLRSRRRNTALDRERALGFMRMVDEELVGVLQQQSAPLVLAARDELRSIYRAANTYPFLFSEGISGDPEAHGLYELHKRAWALLSPYFAEELSKARNAYGRCTRWGLTSAHAGEVSEAARQGRVDVLFVNLDRVEGAPVEEPSRGSAPSGPCVHTGPTTRVFARPEEALAAHSGSSDLVIDAAVETILQNGRVYALGDSRFPETSCSVAAILRY